MARTLGDRKFPQKFCFCAALISNTYANLSLPLYCSSQLVVCIVNISARNRHMNKHNHNFNCSQPILDQITS